jgi:hypothetical protein
MHDEKRWLKYPVLPRPPGVPNFGPEMRALLGLDPSDYERDAPSNEPHPELEAESGADWARETRHEALGAGSEVRAHERRARTGT